MIFRLTTKAKEQLRITQLENINHRKEVEFFSEWYVNIVIINRKKYFLFTEYKTLFSIIKHAKGINTIDSFKDYVGKIIAEILNDIIKDYGMEKFVLNNCIFAKTENNYVRRAQIDHLYHAKHLVDTGQNTFDINRYPVASIGFKMPLDFFVEELQKIIINDNFVFIEDVFLN